MFTIKYAVQHGNDFATGYTLTEFTGRGAKQAALKFAADRAAAGLLSDEFPISIYRAKFNRHGTLKGQTEIGGYRIG